MQEREKGPGFNFTNATGPSGPTLREAGNGRVAMHNRNDHDPVSYESITGATGPTPQNPRNRTVKRGTARVHAKAARTAALISEHSADIVLEPVRGRYRIVKNRDAAMTGETISGIEARDLETRYPGKVFCRIA